MGIKPRAARRVRVEIDVQARGSTEVLMDERLASAIARRLAAGEVVAVYDLEAGDLGWNSIAEGDAGGTVVGLEIVGRLS